MSESHSGDYLLRIYSGGNLSLGATSQSGKYNTPEGCLSTPTTEHTIMGEYDRLGLSDASEARRPCQGNRQSNQSPCRDPSPRCEWHCKGKKCRYGVYAERFTSLLGTFSAMGIPKIINRLDSALYERNIAHILK